MAPFVSLFLTTLALLPSFTFSTATQRRDGVVLPFLDYEGIELAAAEALSDELRRRGLDELAERAMPRHGNAPTCHKISKRKEWRKLTTNEKKGYIKAVKCLLTKDDFGISPISDTFVSLFHFLGIDLRFTLAFTMHSLQ